MTKEAVDVSCSRGYKYCTVTASGGYAGIGNTSVAKKTGVGKTAAGKNEDFFLPPIRTYFCHQLFWLKCMFITSGFAQTSSLPPPVLPLPNLFFHKSQNTYIHNFRVFSLNNHNKYWVKFLFNELVPRTLVGQPGLATTGLSNIWMLYQTNSIHAE